MFLALNELADRVIESLVFKVKGDVYEDRIRVVLRWTIFYSVTLSWLLIGLTAQYFKTLTERQEWNETNTIVQQIFSVDNNPLHSFIEINKELKDRLEIIQAEHIVVIQDNVVLIRDNEMLIRENTRLRLLIGRCPINEN